MNLFIRLIRNKSTDSGKQLFLIIGLLFVSLNPTNVSALTITNVSLSKHQFDPQKNEQISLNFTIDKDANVILHWYDGRDLLIRKQDLGVVKAGSQQASWDGKDNSNQFVPPEAYHYTITALITKTGETVNYDLTDITGGQDLNVDNLNWDPKTKLLNYSLSEPARVNIRAGLDNHGPLLKTLIDWVPRSAGKHQEIWDGYDGSQVMDLTNHPLRFLGGMAFSLPKNTVFILPELNSIQLVDEKALTEKRKINIKQRAKRMHAQAQQKIEDRGDYMASLHLPADLMLDKQGVAVVTGNLPVRLEVENIDVTKIISNRFEVAFYVDGQYIFENEVGFLPITFNWDTSNYPAGEHFLTANLFGYEGNIGMATIKVLVKR